MRFAADAMLGRLATWLRLLGYDTFYQADIDDGLLVRLARDENRTILTRDVGVTRRRGVRVLLIRSDDIWCQVRQVLSHFGLHPDLTSLGGRCPRCNQPLHVVEKDEVTGRVPPYIWQSQKEFQECPACRRLFWRGTHVAEMEARLRGLLVEEVNENRNRE